MKEKLTTFENVLLKEGTTHLLVEYIKQHEDDLSLEFRLIIPETLTSLSLDKKNPELFQEMKAQKELLLESIVSQPISERAKRACLRIGIETVKDLCSRTSDETRGLGMYVWDELSKFLGYCGLWFKDDDPSPGYFTVEQLLERYPNAVRENVQKIHLYFPDNMRSFFYISGVKTIEELCTKTEKEILSYKGCGPATVTDIIAFLRKLGLSLKTEGEWVIPKRQDPASSKEIADILSCKISDFNVPVRVQRVCEFGDIKTIGDLVTHSSMDLLKLPGCGKKTITDIKNLLESLNMELRQGYLKKVS